MYGYNSPKENATLMDVVSENIQYCLNKYPNAVLISGGDFNMVLNSDLDRFPPRAASISSIMNNFMLCFDYVVDIWRKIYPHQRLYTWSSKDRSKQSRIDYWLISQSLANSCKSVSIHATPISDHSAVSLKICFSASLDFSSSPSYWKLNNSLLLFEDVKKNITLLIEQYWRSALVLDSYCCQWELLKFEISKYIRKFGSNLIKLKRAEENEVVSKITTLLPSKPPELFSESDKLEYADLQSKLDEKYIKLTRLETSHSNCYTDFTQQKCF